MKSIYISIVLAFCTMPAFANQNVGKFIKFQTFELEKTELKEIISIVGKTKIHKEGDAGESYTGICYYYPKQNVTVFYESGEMGGSKTLLSYKFFSGQINKFPCATINDKGNEKFTISGLKIGQPLKHALSLLPKDPYSIQGMSYTYWNKIPFTESDFIKTGAKRSDNPAWDEMVTIELYENKGVVSGFGVHRVITW